MDAGGRRGTQGDAADADPTREGQSAEVQVSEASGVSPGSLKAHRPPHSYSKLPDVSSFNKVTGSTPRPLSLSTGPGRNAGRSEKPLPGGLELRQARLPSLGEASGTLREQRL